MIKDIWSKVSYFWFVFMLIIVGFFSGNLDVKAATNQAYNNTYTSIKLTQTTANDPVSTWYGDYNVGTWNTLGNGFLTEWDVHVVGSSNNTFISSRSYYFEFTLGATWNTELYPNTNLRALIGNAQFKVLGSTQNSETGATAQNIKMYSCGVREGNNIQAMIVGCTFQPVQDLQYFRIALVYPNYNKTLGRYSYYSLDHFTYDAGVEGAIENQNILLQNGFENINSNINNSINNSTNTIINNQNQNTQQQIESQRVCKTVEYNRNNAPLGIRGKYLENTGNLSTNQFWSVTDYIKFNKEAVVNVIVTNTSGASICFYDEAKTLKSCSTYGQLNQVFNLDYVGYFRFSYWNNSDTYLKVVIFKNCFEGNQALNDTMTDDSIDDPNSMISDFEDMLATNGVITQLIGLPITFYTKVLDSINGTCSSFNLGILYNTNLIMPCIELSTYLGSNLVNIIDLMITGFFVIHIAKKMVIAFNNFTGMKEGDVLSD